ncbi:MAG: DUF5666 domain-containing protein [Anaerolineae bacterium]|nr:DUF5666 domain-containing protein [Anaerolineae bacterium]
MPTKTRPFPRPWWAAILLTVLVTVLWALPALADDPTPPADPNAAERMVVEFDGQVVARPPGAVGIWQIDGRNVLATNTTRFVPNASSIQVGDWVHVVARERGGQLVAQLIAKTRPIPLPPVRGRIEAMSPTQWTIGGTVVLIDANTRITGDPPNIGDFAVAQVRRTPAGLLATHIHVTDATPPVTRIIRGRIEAIGETSWTIGNHVVLIDADTRIEGDHPDVGDFAVAWVVHTENGLLARRILVQDPSSDRVVVFRGRVVAVQDGVWTVLVDGQEKTVVTDANTRIIGEPTVGDMVGVKGVPLSDGSVLAHVIVKLQGNFPLVSFAGFVTAILPGPTVVGAPVVWEVTAPAVGAQPARTWTVIVTEETKSNVDPAQVAVGAWVKGAGDHLDDGLLQARTVRVTTPPRLPFRGEVTTRPDPTAPNFPQGLWVIGGATVYVTAQTRIEGPVPEVGQQAGGFGVLRPDGALDALLLMALPR